jgi:hypothetical protein
MARLSRRGFLVVAALLAPVVRVRDAFAQRARRAARPQPISSAEFLRLSQRLLGRGSLDPQVASIYRTALVGVPENVPRLAQLASGKLKGAALTSAHRELERTIVEWWYTGAYTINGEARLATHTGALVWSALGMPAPGVCAGAFGAWSQPPRGVS